MPRPRPERATALAPAAVAAALLLATALRAVGLGDASLWFDEAFAAHAAAQPSLAAAWRSDPTNPPLFYALAWLAARALGSGEFALRLPATLLGVVAAALAARVAGRAFGRRAAPWAALLVAVSPLQVWAGREARMYTLLAVCALTAVAGGLAYAGLDGGDRRRDAAPLPSAAPPPAPRPRRGWRPLALVAAAELGALYSHNTGPVVVAALNALALGFWLAARRDARPAWWPWLAAQVVVGAAWAPEWAARFRRLGAANDALAAHPPLDAATLWALWRAQWVVPWGRAPDGAEGWLVAIAFVAVLMAIPWRRPAARALAAAAALLAAGVVAGLIVLENELHGRYLVMAGPPLWAAAAGGLAAARRPVPRSRAAGTWRGARSRLAAGVLVAAAALGLARALASPDWHEDARAMARHQAQTLGPADTVVAMSYAPRYDLATYHDRFGLAARTLTLPEDAGADDVRPRLPRRGRAALAIRYGSPADRRGMLPCLLGERAVGPPERTTTAGLAELRFTLDASLPADVPRAPWPPGDSAMRGASADPAATPGGVAFGDHRAPAGRLVAVDAARRWPADRALCVHAAFVVEAPMAGDLKLAVTAVDARGDEAARADAVLATADQRGSAAVPPGTALEAFALLWLPVGQAPGPLSLWVRVYDPAAAPDGLEPRPAAADVGATSARALRTLTVEATAGTWGVDAPPAIDLPRRLDLATPGGARLVATDAPTEAADAGALSNGGAAGVTLLWRGAGALPLLTVADTAGRWRVDLPPPPPWAAPVRRDRRSFRVPVDAPSGTAELRLPDGTVLGRWAVASAPWLSSIPPTAPKESNGDYPGIGQLVGLVTAGDGAPTPAILDRVAPGSPFTLTLAWLAGMASGPRDADGRQATTRPDLTVFVQLLDANGRVAAQSDARPGGGARPTTGWRDGEVILDVHTLRWNEGDEGGASAPPGPPFVLIAGLYDAASGTRARTADGTDAVVLARVAGMEAGER